MAVAWTKHGQIDGEMDRQNSLYHHHSLTPPPPPHTHTQNHTHTHTYTKPHIHTHTRFRKIGRWTHTRAYTHTDTCAHSHPCIHIPSEAWTNRWRDGQTKLTLPPPLPHPTPPHLPPPTHHHPPDPPPPLTHPLTPHGATHHGATVAMAGVHQLGLRLKDRCHGLLLSFLHPSPIHRLHAHGRIVPLVRGARSDDSVRSMIILNTYQASQPEQVMLLLFFQMYKFLGRRVL